MTESLCSAEQTHSKRFTNMPARRPALKQKVRAMQRRKTALQLIGSGNSVADTARQLGITVQSVRRLLRQGLAAESLYPSNLEPSRIAELRQIESEKLQLAWKKVAEAFAAADPSNGTVVARLAEASAKLSERQAAMWGLNAPTRVVEESLRLSISKSDHTHKVVVSWDQSLLAAPAEPVPGLFIGGRTAAPALADATVSTGGNGQIAGEHTNAPESPLEALAHGVT